MFPVLFHLRSMIRAAHGSVFLSDTPPPSSRLGRTHANAMCLSSNNEECDRVLRAFVSFSYVKLETMAHAALRPQAIEYSSHGSLLVLFSLTSPHTCHIFLLSRPHLIRLRDEGDIVTLAVLGALRVNDGNRDRESPSRPATYWRMTPLTKCFVNGNVHQSNTPRANTALCSDHHMCV